ncbi:hypothetical protein A1353_00550 [Methylomonas methanica]|uniref:Lipoprotein n=1 Tax=Methylomonas methanica TaxID=421 RepID=A0A177M7S6_METMH|nr:hypothetical protein [Methylomonas methanica]OAI01742.1 hypothetical protein A1353_00550 [Methylomonas methanica]
MFIVDRNTFTTLIVIAVSTSVSGCSVFLPAHTKSNVRDQEQVQIRFLERDDMLKSYKNEYEEAFGSGSLMPTEPQQPGALVPAAAAASIAVGFAFDYVKKQLEQEATLYEAQYSSSIADDRFWSQVPEVKDIFLKKVTKTTRRESKTDKDVDFKLVPPVTEVTEEVRTSQASFDSTSASLAQRYFGIELTRSTQCPLLASEDEKTKEMDGSCRVIASKLVYGLRPSSDNQMFRVVPIYFTAKYAKAKVPSDEIGWWFAPWTWPGKFAKNPGHNIDIDISLEIDGYWRGKDQQLNIDKVAAIHTQVSGYDLDKRPTLTPKKGLGGTQSGGWLVGVPISFKPDGTPAIGPNSESGSFTAKILVTERDTSNAKKLLEQGAEIIGKEGSRLKDEIQK